MKMLPYTLFILYILRISLVDMEMEFKIFINLKIVSVFKGGYILY